MLLCSCTERTPWERRRSQGVTSARINQRILRGGGEPPRDAAGNGSSWPRRWHARVRRGRDAVHHPLSSARRNRRTPSGDARRAALARHIRAVTKQAIVQSDAPPRLRRRRYPTSMPCLLLALSSRGSSLRAAGATLPSVLSWRVTVPGLPRASPVATACSIALEIACILSLFSACPQSSFRLRRHTGK